MWELGNRGIILLISVLTGCALIYNAWGPILALVITVFLIIYACYLLAINDSVLFPHAFLILDHLRDAAVELKFTLATVLVYVTGYALKVRDYLLGRYRQRFGRMEKRRRSNYQLSTDPSPSRSSPVGRNSTANAGRSPRFMSLLEQLSPITGSAYKDYEDENRVYRETDFGRENQEEFGVITSTPAIQQRSDARNGDLGRFATGKITPRKRSPMYSQNHTLSRGDGETYFTPAGSPWGNSISPKLRSKAGGIKTVQTVAGPLLASTRYNIDPKVYSDVTSPGLTTRLTKYATEANGKLTYQAQYGTGQFPKVNLHAGPLPLLNRKAVKNRTPVTVRVAPPEAARYSPPERQRILSKVCQVEENPPSVVEVLREISLKRHASREEIAADLIKKQRTDGIYTNELEDMEEMNQKRGRDESSKLEDDISPQSKVIRPAKRTKTPSCNDILNSLSSSINVASGVKRKAIDFSRSGTPDFEKHFKSLESVPTTSVEAVTTPQNVASRQKPLGLREHHAREEAHKSPNRSPEIIQVKSILKLPGKQSIIVRTEEPGQKSRTHIKNMRTQPENSVAPSAPVNVADKLFMRAERPVNEKLKSLVEEQGNIKAKFTGDDAEEIKKEDIVNMRQTSMRARLQSMFDAISGKAPSRINPDVVIQAEEVTPVVAEVPTTCATLNSCTTTTNVNTTPISTSAIAPFGSSGEPNTRQTKHVAFNLPTTQSSSTAATTQVQKATTPSEMSKVSNTSLSGSQNGGTSTSLSFPGSNAGPALSFGKTTSSLAMPTSSIPATTSSVLSFGVSAASAPSSTAVSASNLPNFGTSSTTPTAPSFSMPKTQTGFGNLSNSTMTAQTSTAPTANFSFGSSATNTTLAVTPNVSAAPLFASQAGLTSVPAAVSTATASATPSNTLSATSATSATSTPSLFSFGNNPATVQTTKSELFSFNPASSVAPTGTGFGPPTTTTSMLFGTTTTTTYSFMSQNSTATTSTASFGGTTTAASTFGVARTTSIFSFATAKPSVSESKLLFSFNASTVTTAGTTPTISSSMSIFGSTSNTTPSFVSPTTSAPAFATQASSASGFNQPALFTGTPSTSAPAFGTPATSTSTFGVPGTSAPAFGTPTTTATTFGTPSTTASTFGKSATGASAFSTPTTTAPPQFGQGSALFATPTTNTFGTAPPVFGGASTAAAVNSFNTPQTTTSISVFGAGTISASKPASTAAPLFSNTNTPVATTSAGTKSVFGSTSGMFAQPKLPNNYGTGTPLFGATSPPVFGSQASTSAFAANNPTTTAPATTVNLAFGANTVTTASATLTFGSTSTSSPAFGGGQTLGATTQAQNTSTAPTFAGGSSIFGTETSSAPIFGSTSTSTSGGFCSTPSAFGGQNTGAIPFGGTGNPPPAFGENRPSPFGVATTSAAAFGTPASTVTTTAPIFGTASSTPAGGMFPFGGAQKPAQMNTTFPFSASGASSNNNNNAQPPAAAPFQFTGGQANPAPAAGYNFTPPASPSINFNTSGAPTFNAPASGMFSIGSGSTAPRSRNVRQRKPR